MDSRQLFGRYQQLQRYVGWSQQDVARVRWIGEQLSDRLEVLIDDFYREAFAHEPTRRVLTDEAQLERLKYSLRRWLLELFAGPYDADYVARRSEAGRKHVKIGLDHAFVAAALSRLRDGMCNLLATEWRGAPEELAAVLSSLHRLLDLDLAIIEDAYETERVRELGRLERERQEETFKKLVEAAGCVIVILRDDGGIAYFSPFAEQLTGLSFDEVAGRDYVTLCVPETDRAGVRRGLRSVMQGQALQGVQHDLVARHGQRCAMLWNARRLEDYDGAPAALAVGHDISTLKEAQHKALRSERLAVIGQMSTVLAHESRNALQRIQACAEMLEMEVEGNPEAEDLVERIQAAQDHLHRLLDEVRGYAAPLHLDRTKCALPGVWREAWDLLANQRQGRDTSLREELVDGDLVCHVDRFRLVQVFRNLMENSLAACADPVEISVRVMETTLRHQPAICLCVRDNGPGFSREQRQLAFEPFYTTKTKGTGLGMAIALRIVEAHGGTIDVGETAPEGGAEIRIVLPRVPPSRLPDDA